MSPCDIVLVEMHVASKGLHSEHEALLVSPAALSLKGKQPWLFWNRWSQQTILCTWGGEIMPASLAAAPLKGLSPFCILLSPTKIEFLWLCLAADGVKPLVCRLLVQVWSIQEHLCQSELGLL